MYVLGMLSFMKFSRYLLKVDFFSKSEFERVKFLTYYHQSIDNQYEFTVDDICKTFFELGLPSPNKSRLKKRITTSKIFVKGSKANHFRMHANEYIKLKKDLAIPTLEDDEEIETINTVLHISLYTNTRGYIERLAKQINASYENNLFDGCAVLMRRLLEILLIHTYENFNIESQIKNDFGDYNMLSDIVNNAKTNTAISLSRSSKKCLESFRELGNFSAHKIFYNARKNDIDTVLLNYRATIEELLYKSSLKK